MMPSLRRGLYRTWPARRAGPWDGRIPWPDFQRVGFIPMQQPEGHEFVDGVDEHGSHETRKAVDGLTVKGVDDVPGFHTRGLGGPVRVHIGDDHAPSPGGDGGPPPAQA